MMHSRYSLLGQRFDRLSVIDHAGKDTKGNFLWRCKCDCGGEKTTIGANLRGGRVRSCGCLIIEAMHKPKRRHGHAGNPALGEKPSPTYQAWKNMIARCTQPSYPSYEHYKARGITVCDRWKSFENFYADMGDRPGGFREYTLERVDNDKGYEPGNCEWATWSVQAKNRTDNSGEKNPAAKLTNEQAAAIRSDPRRQHVIAAEYGVRQQQISRIKSGKRRRNG